MDLESQRLSVPWPLPKERKQTHEIDGVAYLIDIDGAGKPKINFTTPSGEDVEIFYVYYRSSLKITFDGFTWECLPTQESDYREFLWKGPYLFGRVEPPTELLDFVRRTLDVLRPLLNEWSQKERAAMERKRQEARESLDRRQASREALLLQKLAHV
jgi:hypothetical protein